MFASYSVCTTVAIVTITWLLKFVDEVGSTVFHRSSLRGFTTRRTISKADLPDNFTIFHCRMSTIQPAWPLCTTSVCWHTCCWHFGSCSIHVTRVNSFTFVNIWETKLIFALYHVCHFKNRRTLSHVRITLIIINNKTNFPLFCVSQIKCLKPIFHHKFFNLSSYRLWNNWLVRAAPTKRYHPSGGKSSQNTAPDGGIA